jgi:serine/threonine protein kinase
MTAVLDSMLVDVIKAQQMQVPIVDREEIVNDIPPMCGHGASAIVWYATWRRDPSKPPIAVVVKEFEPTISLECSLQFLLHHKNILPSLALVRCPKGVTGVCFPRGTPLNEVLRVFDPKAKKRVAVDIPFDRRMKWALGIAEGVEYIHRQWVVHRDLKSANIIVVSVNGEEVAQLMDFGAAKIMEVLGGTMTVNSGGVGTPAYMAPEMFVDGAKRNYYLVDVYALSMVVWETLSGEEPLGGRKVGEIRDLLLKKHFRPEIPSTWPLEVQRAIRRGWSEDPMDRGLAVDMCEALRKKC